jgi:Sua5/YciO/YrdC/YwlC family protein
MIIYSHIDAAKALKEGKIIAVATDTVYGLLANGDDVKAVEKLYALKRRPSEKSCIVFIAKKADLSNYAQSVPKYVEKIIDVYWPGGLTCIFTASDKMPNKTFLHDKTSVGIRMPNSPEILNLIEAVGTTVISTSANISGEPVITDWQEMQRKFGDEVIIWSLTNDNKSATASTIIDVRDAKSWQILREGAITKEQLWQVIDQA